MEQGIRDVCKEIEEMLIAKNRAYGNSVSNPLRVFSKATTMEQVNVRLDDKLSRLARGHEYAHEDTILDLIGYLILRRVLQKREEQKAQEEPPDEESSIIDYVIPGLGA